MNEHEHATFEVDYVDKKMAYYTHLSVCDVVTFETKRFVTLRKNLTA